MNERIRELAEQAGLEVNADGEIGPAFFGSIDAIYPANGTFEDYVYWKHGSWSNLLELRNGSAKDVAATVPAVAKFFELIDSTPSSKNQFQANCTRVQGPDLRRE